MIALTPPRAVRGKMPFKHRTVAELDKVLGFYMGSKLERKLPYSIDRLVGMSEDTGINGLKQLATMPDTSCPRCGARGWCGHNGRNKP